MLLTRKLLRKLLKESGIAVMTDYEAMKASGDSTAKEMVAANAIPINLGQESRVRFARWLYGNTSTAAGDDGEAFIVENIDKLIGKATGLPPSGTNYNWRGNLNSKEETPGFNSYNIWSGQAETFPAIDVFCWNSVTRTDVWKTLSSKMVAEGSSYKLTLPEDSALGISVKFASSLGGATAESMQDPESLAGASSKPAGNKHKFSVSSIEQVLKMILANCGRYKFDLAVDRMEDYQKNNPTSTMGVLEFENEYLDLFTDLPEKTLAKYILENVSELRGQKGKPFNKDEAATSLYTKFANSDDFYEIFKSIELNMCGITVFAMPHMSVQAGILEALNSPVFVGYAIKRSEPYKLDNGSVSGGPTGEVETDETPNTYSKVADDLQDFLTLTAITDPTEEVTSYVSPQGKAPGGSAQDRSLSNLYSPGKSAIFTGIKSLISEAGSNSAELESLVDKKLSEYMSASKSELSSKIISKIQTQNLATKLSYSALAEQLTKIDENFLSFLTMLGLDQNKIDLISLKALDIFKSSKVQDSDNLIIATSASSDFKESLSGIIEMLADISKFMAQLDVATYMIVNKVKDLIPSESGLPISTAKNPTGFYGDITSQERELASKKRKAEKPLTFKGTDKDTTSYIDIERPVDMNITLFEQDHIDNLFQVTDVYPNADQYVTKLPAPDDNYSANGMQANELFNILQSAPKQTVFQYCISISQYLQFINEIYAKNEEDENLLPFGGEKSTVSELIDALKEINNHAIHAYQEINGMSEEAVELDRLVNEYGASKTKNEEERKSLKSEIHAKYSLLINHNESAKNSVSLISNIIRDDAPNLMASLGELTRNKGLSRKTQDAMAKSRQKYAATPKSGFVFVEDGTINKKINIIEQFSNHVKLNLVIQHFTDFFTTANQRVTISDMLSLEIPDSPEGNFSTLKGYKELFNQLKEIPDIESKLKTIISVVKKQAEIDSGESSESLTAEERNVALTIKDIKEVYSGGDNLTTSSSLSRLKDALGKLCDMLEVYFLQDVEPTLLDEDERTPLLNKIQKIRDTIRVKTGALSEFKLPDDIQIQKSGIYLLQQIGAFIQYFQKEYIETAARFILLQSVEELILLEQTLEILKMLQVQTPDDTSLVKIQNETKIYESILRELLRYSN